MRVLLAAGLIVCSACAHALDDTPTQGVYLIQRADEARGAARERAEPIRRPRHAAHAGKAGGPLAQGGGSRPFVPPPAEGGAIRWPAAHAPSMVARARQILP